VAERRPLVIVTGRVRELPAGDTLPGGSPAAALKIVYTDETLTISTNTQLVAATSLEFIGTGGLVIEGTGRLAIL
jgi:hypothetical protein